MTSDVGAGLFEPGLGWLRSKQGVKWHRPASTLIPAWVADMDFPVAPPIRATIQASLDRGDLGYPDWPENPLAQPFATRMRGRYGWNPAPAHVRGVTDLIQALQIVLQLATQPGQAVVAHTPNYPPFLATIASMGRQLVAAPLHADRQSWTWDHQRLEADTATASAAVLLLVNPHNPTGRAFTRDELEQVADLAARHDLIVISDEIHAELIHDPHAHIPFASLSSDTAARTVTVTSATKAFNIAGLRTAVAHIGPAALRHQWDRQPPDLYGATNVLGVAATLAAWQHGEPWLTQLREHLRAQRDHIGHRMPELRGIDWIPPEASYLAWLDCSALGGTDLAEHLRQQAQIELSPGPDFGPGNCGRTRLNFATSRALLDTILDRIATITA